MKNSLSRHIATVFSALKINDIPFEVYECGVDALPDWTNQVQMSHEFFVCCREHPQKDRLQKFLSKEIHHSGEYFYWFEGEQITEDLLPATPTDQPSTTENSEQHFEQLKTNTRLPAWLDDYIFKNLNAEYAPDFQRFDFNLDLTADENLKYLGTYFPRSYSEAFCVFDNIFQNNTYLNAITDKDTLNILSIGCGTGGDIIGLLTIIEKYCSNSTTINILAIDGNANALEILKKVVGKYENNSSKIVNLNALQRTLFAESESQSINELLRNQQFDFIISFKMITEVIAVGKGKNDNAYYSFVKTFVPLLSATGLCLLLDVTTKQEHNNTFNPILMNFQVNQALAELQQFKTLLPLPCNLHENHCNQSCFSQQIFNVTHSKKTKDISKVAYRVIAHKEFVEKLCRPDTSAIYPIGRENICCFTIPNEKESDAYLLSNLTNIQIDKSKSETVLPKINTECEEIFTTAKPTLTSPKIIGTIDISPFEKKNKTYIIDTNMFLDCPDIIQKIDKKDNIVLSAKVIDELDSLKVKLPDKLNEINTAFRIINRNMEGRKIMMEPADLKLLPDDFNKKSPDNFILSVALKCKDNNPILLTSDNGLQVKAKGVKIKTKSLVEFIKSSKK